MHCTLTQFNWTTRTHCTNTTYLLSLDTIQCTSTTLHMNNLLHLCTSICCSTNLLLIYNLLHLTLLLCIDYIMYRYCTSCRCAHTVYNVSLIIECVFIVHYVYWVYVCVFCTLSSAQSVNMYCPYVNCLLFFCTVCPYVNCCCCCFFALSGAL